jgi:hypothetical protein
MKMTDEQTKLISDFLEKSFDSSEFMKAGGVFTTYGFTIGDYIKASTDMLPLQSVLQERYAVEDTVVH